MKLYDLLTDFERSKAREKEVRNVNLPDLTMQELWQLHDCLRLFYSVSARSHYGMVIDELESRQKDAL